ncbi:MAG: PEP-CTERM system histidine kinase PrsK [Burkholderiales bacterium]|nr:PEP-CTERM system histidine kinase PrsK [Burkholderiales bacterium]
MDLRALGVASFAAAALAWFVLFILLTLRRTGDRTGRALLAAVVVQIGWAVASTVMMLRMTPAAGAAVAWLEALRGLAWIALLLQLLASGRPADRSGTTASDAARLGDAIGAGAAADTHATGTRDADDLLRRSRRSGLWLAAGLTVASIIVDLLSSNPQWVFAMRTLLAVYGLVCLEQVYRNTPQARRWALKFLAVALGALFGFDLFVFSDAMLYSRLNESWWIARGFANALLVPLLAIAAARNKQWQLDINVSRHAIFHSTALFGAGAYLVLMAAGGYYIRYFGGAWGEIAQTLLIFAAAVGLAIVLLSGAARARLRVFLSKHFFSYRFDYREEWLRLTRLLTEGDSHEGEPQDLPHRVIRALGRPVESPGGALWLRDGDAYRFAAGIRNWREAPFDVPIDAPLATFLKQREWVIELAEWRIHPERYDGLQLPAALTQREEAWLIVPLVLDADLLGFIVLTQPLAPLTVDWEVRDLLKTAARQVASYLGVQRAIEQLVQAQQFESFNRMSAFVVHDLKNLVAQLGLLTRNAQRHRDNPEFQDDMLATVENVMERMQGLLLQLRAGTRPIDQPEPVPVGDTLTQAVAAKRGLKPEATIEIGEDVSRRTVLAHRDRLERVIGHLVQNAAEASGPSGMIRVRARREGALALIEVEDNGKGMSEEFIRSRLFKPFVSTKAHGMGIGTFESREYVKELGGSLDVESREGLGTIFRIRLPLAGAAEPSAGA